MSLCAAPSKISASVRPARPARAAMAVRCEAAPSPVDRVKQVGAAALSAAVLTVAAPSYADLGEEVFGGNCVACHLGGGNTVNSNAPLAKGAIKANLGAFDVETITYQIRNGGGGMPAWEDELSDEQIDAVANYVYQKADTASW